ncbi:MAG: hypothetical protein ABFS41_08860 [Myxococcota bacterium]
MALLLLLFATSVVASAAQEEPDRSAFLLGWKAGAVDQREAKILEAFTTLELLQASKGEGIERVVSLQRQSINVDLLALSQSLDEMAAVTSWPPEIRVIAAMKSANVKEAFRRLRSARSAGRWQDPDAENEKAIQRIFAVYEQFGNPLRIESD